MRNEKTLLERTVIRAIKDAARRRGMEAVRLSFRQGAGAGWPDFVIVGPRGRTLWLEAKRLGGELRPLQEHRREALLNNGHRWAKPETPEEAVAVVEAFAEDAGA